jgi:tryptophanyl-tRNA synthetase
MEETKPEQPVEAKKEEETVQEAKQEAEDFVVNPYTISSASNKEIDYDKLIQKFGCYHLNEDLVKRMEKITNQPAHYFIRRGIFFSHRDLDAILTAC